MLVKNMVFYDLNHIAVIKYLRPSGNISHREVTQAKYFMEPDKYNVETNCKFEFLCEFDFRASRVNRNLRITWEEHIVWQVSAEEIQEKSLMTRHNDRCRILHLNHLWTTYNTKFTLRADFVKLAFF